MVRCKADKSSTKMEKPQPPAESPSSMVSVETKIDILMEEYRALYSLLTFRLTAMDRRLPTIGGVMAAILSATTAMPPLTQAGFLLGLPSALVWFVAAAAQHLRSKEDHVRRIDEIERQVNRLAGQELLVFQSCHPNNRRFPGGRTGLMALFTVVSATLAMLTACAGVTLMGPSAVFGAYQAGYLAYLACCTVAVLTCAIRVAGYSYRRPSAIESSPLWDRQNDA